MPEASSLSTGHGRRVRPWVWAATAALVVLPPGSLWLGYALLDRPTGLPGPCRVRVEPGMTARQIGQRLEAEGLIRSARLFAWSARLAGLSQRLEAGTYELDGRASTQAVLRRLLQAPLELTRLTVPEGLTRHQTAALLQRCGVADSARFVAVTGRRDLAQELGVSAEDLEGFLYPETYLLDPGASEAEIARRMVRQFFLAFSDTLRTRVDALDLSLGRAVTLASIVEQEAKAEAERPIIAAIFYRRLGLGRRLESCATVEYALGVHKEHLTSADLQVASPYNTYLHGGLPPGPICSPGRAALVAALYPTQTDYLYFVARGDGTHRFSRTLREHEAAKARIRRQQRPRPPESGR